MAENSKIQWCTHTFNPWRGCTKVSDGCKFCYAETMSKRNPLTLGVWGPNGTRVVAAEKAWREPLKWDRLAAKAGERHRVFCASLADVFEDWRGLMADHTGDTLFLRNGKWTTNADPDDDPPLTMQDVRQRLFDLIDRTPNLDWLLLTKRPENVLEMMPGCGWVSPTKRAIPVRDNVWFGTSVEDQATADERIPRLLRVPAKIRFLSVEPLLGPVRFRDVPGFNIAGSAGQEMLRNLWAIIGGESGHHARPCNIEWIRDIVRQCKAAGVPVFVKQVGSNPVSRLNDGETWPGGNGLPSSGAIRFSGDGFGNYFVTGLRDPKGGDPDEWPAELRVREVPR